MGVTERRNANQYKTHFLRQPIVKEPSQKHRKTKPKRMRNKPKRRAEIIWHVKKNTEKFYRQNRQGRVISITKY